MRLVFVGPPGAGKGTQAERIIDYLDVPHLSTGDMLREALATETDVGRAAKEYISTGQLVPDEIVLQIVCQRLNQSDCQDGCLFDGFPRNIDQAQALDGLLEQRGSPLNLVLELVVDEDKLIERLLGRGRTDDNPGVIRQRLVVYREQTAPLSDYYENRGILRQIDGNGTVDEVSALVRTVLDDAGRKKEQKAKEKAK